MDLPERERLLAELAAWLAAADVAALDWTASSGRRIPHVHATLSESAVVRLDRDHRPTGHSDSAIALPPALSADPPECAAGAHTHLAARAVSGRRYDEASRHMIEGLACCKPKALDAWRIRLLVCRARMRFEQGHWLEAVADTKAILQHPRTTPDSRIQALIVSGHLRIRRGDPGATAPLEEARALISATPELRHVGMLAAACAEAAWLAGDQARIFHEGLPACGSMGDRGDLRMSGDLGVWLRRVDALDRHQPEVAGPDAAQISRDWRAEADYWNDLGCPYERAIVLASYGKEPEQRQALGILDGLNACPAARALRRRMRSSGMLGIPRGSRTSTRSNPQGLTRREAQILELLCEGFPNAAIADQLSISTRTVDHHVSAILAKLGVPSRAKAVAKARVLQGPGT